MLKMNKLVKIDSNHSKLHGLEILRFISAIAVLIWHYQHFFYNGLHKENFYRDRQPFYDYLEYFYSYGYIGVQIFWCISGFIFFWKYRLIINQKLISFEKFFVLRMSRLYPLHIITLVFVLILQSIYTSINGTSFVYSNNDYLHFIYQLFLASNWGFQNGDSFNGPIWSISVEFLVYFVFYFTIRNFGKSYLINLFFIFIFAISKYLGFKNPIFECLALFFIGGLSANIFKCFENSIYFNFLYFSTIVILFLFPLFSFMYDISKIPYFSIISIMFYMPFCLFFCARDYGFSRRFNKFIENCGNMTYASYLIHFPLQIIIILLYFYIHEIIPYYSGTFFVLYLALTLIFSFFIYKYFEKPVQDYIRQKLLN